MANTLLRFNKRATHVVTSNQPHFEGKLRSFRKTNCCGYTRIRHSNNDVCVDGVLIRQTPSQIFARFIDADTINNAVRTGKVHELEDAMPRAGRSKGM